MVRRLGVVTAKALTFLPSICEVVLVVWSHIRSTCPPIRSVIAGAVPLYGTVVMSILSAFMSNSPQRCEAAPTPALARFTLPLLASSQVRSSAKVVGRQRGAADQRHRHVVDHAQVFEVALDLEGDVAHQRGHGGHADVVQQQGVAVGGGLGDLVRADRAAGAGGVVDHDDRAAQGLAHGFGQVARHAVGGAAGGERHDDGDGLVLDGEVGRLGAQGDSGQHSQGSEGLDQ